MRPGTSISSTSGGYSPLRNRRPTFRDSCTSPTRPLRDETTNAPLSPRPDLPQFHRAALDNGCRELHKFVRIQIRMGQRIMRAEGITIKKDEIEEFAKSLKRTRRAKGVIVEKSERELLEEAQRKIRIPQGGDARSEVLPL